MYLRVLSCISWQPICIPVDSYVQTVYAELGNRSNSIIDNVTCSTCPVWEESYRWNACLRVSGYLHSQRESMKCYREYGTHEGGFSAVGTLYTGKVEEDEKAKVVEA